MSEGKFSDKDSNSSCFNDSPLCNKKSQTLETLVVQGNSAGAQLSLLAPFLISSLPFIVRASGTYRLSDDFFWPNTGGAITVQANGVTIDGRGHKITLGDPSGAAVVAINVTEVTVKNLAVEQATGVIPNSTNNNAVRFLTVRNGIIQKVRASGLSRPVVIAVNSRHVIVEDSSFENMPGITQAIGAGVQIGQGAEGVWVNRCTFNGTNGGNPILGPISGIAIQNSPAARNIEITNCNFVGVDRCVNITLGNLVLIRNCTGEAAPNAFFNFIQLGSGGTNIGNDVIIEKCTFRGLQAQPGFDGIVLANGRNCLLKNLTIQCNSSQVPAFPGSAALHIGAVNYRNVKVIDTVISGPNTNAVSLNVTQNVILDNLIITESQTGIEYIQAQNTTVKNSDIEGNTTGVLINPSSRFNTLSQNNIRSNTTAITDNGTSNLFKENNIYGNTNFGTTNPSTQLVNNTTFLNPVLLEDIKVVKKIPLHSKWDE